MRPQSRFWSTGEPTSVNDTRVGIRTENLITHNFNTEGAGRAPIRLPFPAADVRCGGERHAEERSRACRVTSLTVEGESGHFGALSES